jgi:hypothetical protein
VDWLKKFFGGFFAKLGGFAALAVVPIIVAGAAWIAAPYGVTVSRWVLVVAVAAAATLVCGAYALGLRRATRRFGGPKRRLAPIDSLQESVLRLLWEHPDATVKFEVLVRLLEDDPNTVRLACERLQSQGFVAGNFLDSNALVQLLSAGREYIDKRSLSKGAQRFLLERFQCAEGHPSHTP